MPFLEPMSRYLSESGFGLFSFDTEGGDGQYEFDFDYAPALEMADKLTFFRLDGQAGREGGRARRDVHAEAVHRRVGAPGTTST